MGVDLVRTNLGKWGRSTQLFYEHGYLTHVFRVPFDYPSLLVLCGAAGDCPPGAEVVSKYEALVFLEDVYHDYDKLFVPADMLNPADMAAFRDHGRPEAPRNRAALEVTLRALPGDFPLFPDDLAPHLEELVLTRVDVLREVLRAINFAHEGPRTPEKVEAVGRALALFFEAEECDVDRRRLRDLARIHTFSIRVADAVASSQSGPAFKSDVTDWVNVLDQTVGDAVFHVTSVALNPAFAESFREDVVTGYYEFYSECRAWLDGVVEGRGVLVEDNLSLAAAAWLGPRGWDAEASLRSHLSGAGFGGATVDDLVTVSDVEVDPRSDPEAFDARLRAALLDALTAVHSPSPPEGDGVPCLSCGRPSVGRVWRSGEYRERFGARPKDLTLTTLERTGNLGYLRASSGPVLGVESRFTHNDLLLCETCASLAARGGGRSKRSGVLVTLLVRSLQRTLRLRPGGPGVCGEGEDPLASRVFSFHLKGRLISAILSRTGVEGGRLYGSSVLTWRIPATPRDLAAGPGELIRILGRGGSSLLGLPLSFEIPDGEVAYVPEWGLRLGTGPMSAGAVWDSELVPGVWDPGEYLRTVEGAAAVEGVLARMGVGGPAAGAALLQGAPTVTSAIGRLLRSSGPVGGAVDPGEVLDAAAAAVERPGDLLALRSILRSALRRGR